MSVLAIYKKRIRRSLRGCSFKPSFRLCLFEEGFCFDLFGFLIALPFLDRLAREPYELMESWGVYLNGVESQWKFDSIVLCWGDHTKFLHMPWEWKHIKHEVRRADGSWVPFVGGWEVGRDIKNKDGQVVIKGGKEPDGREELSFPYRYVLRSGEIQERIATVHVERREWRRKWTYWFPFFAKRRQSIDVRFDNEVGERTGSWKGGVVGCGYTMLPNETPEMTLRRMEQERIFD